MRLRYHQNEQRHSDAGIAYLSLLILVAIMSIVAASAVQLGSIVQRRAAEEELLGIGTEFQQAFVSYANATPVGQSPYPHTLDDLLRDPRYPNVRRHLRKLYADPMTGEMQWGTVPSIDGKGVMGVYSLSAVTPIKLGNFDMAFQDFTGKTSYAEWVFMAPVPAPLTLK